MVKRVLSSLSASCAASKPMASITLKPGPMAISSMPAAPVAASPTSPPPPARSCKWPPSCMRMAAMVPSSSASVGYIKLPMPISMPSQASPAPRINSPTSPAQARLRSRICRALVARSLTMRMRPPHAAPSASEISPASLLALASPLSSPLLHRPISPAPSPMKPAAAPSSSAPAPRSPRPPSPSAPPPLSPLAPMLKVKEPSRRTTTSSPPPLPTHPASHCPPPP